MLRSGFGIAAAVLVLMLGVAVSIPVPSLGGSSIAIAAIQRAKSFVELMHQRSPGKRLVAHLAQTKHKKFVAHERALPKIRRQPPPRQVAMPAFPTELAPALVDLVAPAIPVQMAGLEASPVGPFSEQPPGFILPPTEGPAPPLPLPPIGPPSPVVPEPSSWAMLLLGFALMGWGLRFPKDREQVAA